MLDISSIARLALAGSAALVIGMAASAGHRQAVQAVSADQPTPRVVYVVSAGISNGGVIVNEFVPEVLRIHPGDEVAWDVSGPHNVHFRPADGIAPVAGQGLLDPTITSGAVYRGGDANSGLLVQSGPEPAFSLVIDLPPGTYDYRCDIHSTMRGVIEVVAPDETVPGPEEVETLRAQAIADTARPAANFFSGFRSSYNSRASSGD